MSLLPKNKPVPIMTVNQQFKLLVYGAPMSGKSHFAATWPNPLFLNTDNNLKQLPTPRILFREYTTENGIVVTIWEQFVAVINQLTNEEHSYETIVVDLIEDFYEAVRRYYFRRYNKTHESDWDWGKGYQLIRVAFLTYIRQLVTLPTNVIFISHTEEKISIINNQSMSVSQPVLISKVLNKVRGMCDAVAELKLLNILPPGGKTPKIYRVLQVNASTTGTTGTRMQVKEDVVLADYKEFIENFKNNKGGK